WPGAPPKITPRRGINHLGAAARRRRWRLSIYPSTGDEKSTTPGAPAPPRRRPRRAAVAAPPKPAHGRAPTAHSRPHPRDASLPAHLRSRRVVLARQPPEGERAEQQAEVAQGDVVVAGVGEEVDDDSGQPGGDDVGAV